MLFRSIHKPATHGDEPQSDKRGSQDSPLIVQIKSTESAQKEAADAQNKANDDAAIKHRELDLTAVIAIAALVQAGFAFFQWQVYTKQSAIMDSSLKESRRSTDALIQSNRPFIVIENRNDKAFWMVNKGKSPARFIFFNPMPFDGTVVYDDLPDNLYYGHKYGGPGVEQINVPWLGAGEERLIFTAFGYIDEKVAANRIPGTFGPVVYGGIIYTGLDGFLATRPLTSTSAVPVPSISGVNMDGIKTHRNKSSAALSR